MGGFELLALVDNEEDEDVVFSAPTVDGAGAAIMDGFWELPSAWAFFLGLPSITSIAS